MFMIICLLKKHQFWSSLLTDTRHALTGEMMKIKNYWIVHGILGILLGCTILSYTRVLPIDIIPWDATIFGFSAMGLILFLFAIELLEYVKENGKSKQN
jgi:hypothetical protein